MIRKYSIWIFVAVVVLLPVVVFAVVKWYEHSFTPLPVLGDKGHTISNFSMINQNGAAVSTDDWSNKIVIADFFFTHCPVVCPKMTASLKKIKQRFPGDEEILINSFSVDPERDDVSTLKSYADRFGTGSNWNLLTGSKKEIYKLARKSFLVVATDGDGGPDDFIHSELLVLVDKKLRIRGYYNGTDSDDVQALIRDIKRLKKEN